mgnify:CR=1 FL=1
MEEFSTDGDDLDALFNPLDGTAMFSTACKMNHSCDPNVVVLYRTRNWGEPLAAHMVAVKDICAGEELCISYIEAWETLENRTKALADYGFVCQCAKCESERNGNQYKEGIEKIVNEDALLFGDDDGSENDQENLTMQELVELFTVERVNSSPARFDMKKLEAINGDKIRALTLDKFLEWSLPFLINAKVITGNEQEIEVVKSALPIIQERIIKLSEIPAMLNFLFVKDFKVEAEELDKLTDEASQNVLKVALAKVEPLQSWDHAGIEAVLRSALIDELGLKPRIAFSALRIAVTGSHISPPLFESLELLGKERSIDRIKAVISK